MTLLYTDNPIFPAAGFLSLLLDNVVLFSVIGAVLLVIVALSFLIFKENKKKRKQHEFEVVPPVKDIIGNDSERLEELNKELRPFGFAYEPYQDVFYSILNPWQRELGYCRLYDEASTALSMIIDCEPISFEYNGYKWLIEFWKGQYGMTTGGEVGIYYTTGTDINIPGLFNGTFYRCVKDEDLINMSFALRKNGNLLFTRSAYHWWLTGFKLGVFSYPSELTMDIVLDLYDNKMAKAFVEGLIKVGYRDNEYSQQGQRVMIHFDKPHTKQPITRTPFIEFIMQRNNEAYCNSYNYLTSAYTETLDKLEIVRMESPDMYQRILNVGKQQGVFEAFQSIKGYLDNK